MVPDIATSGFDNTSQQDRALGGDRKSRIIDAHILSHDPACPDTGRLL